MNISEQMAYHHRRVTHRNIEAVTSAMSQIGVRSVTAFVEARSGTGEMDLDMDWVYDADFNPSAEVPDVTIEDTEFGDDGQIRVTREMKGFRAAVRDTMQDALKTTAPGWERGDSASGGVAIISEPAAAFARVNIDVDLNEEDGDYNVSKEVSAKDPLTPFGVTNPLDVIPAGWLKITNEEQAAAASDLAGVGLQVFDTYKKSLTVGRRPAEWGFLLRHNNEEPVADVVVAAQLKDDREPYDWPGIGFAVGYGAQNAYPAFKDEINEFASSEQLHMQENYGGFTKDNEAVLRDGEDVTYDPSEEGGPGL